MCITIGCHFVNRLSVDLIWFDLICAMEMVAKAAKA